MLEQFPYDLGVRAPNKPVVFPEFQDILVQILPSGIGSTWRAFTYVSEIHLPKGAPKRMQLTKHQPPTQPERKISPVPWASSHTANAHPTGDQYGFSKISPFWLDRKKSFML